MIDEEVKKRVALNKNRMLLLAQDLYDVERAISKNSVMNPAVATYALDLTRARWALKGLAGDLEHD